jgi:hypothetical protein
MRDVIEAWRGETDKSFPPLQHLPSNWLQTYKMTPGQTLAAISNDAGAFTLIISELTK